MRKVWNMCSHRGQTGSLAQCVPLSSDSGEERQGGTTGRSIEASY